MHTVFVFDIDSTIANNNHRASLLKKRCNVCLYEPMPIGHHQPCPVCGGTSSKPSQESWDAFLDEAAVLRDPPIEKGIEVLNKLRAFGATIVFLTGRNESALGDVTRKWLAENAGWTGDEPLYMRGPEDENTSASTYKERAVQRLISTFEEPCMLVFFEDDPHVFNVYNRYGLCIRCPEAWQHLAPAGAVGDESVFSR